MDARDNALAAERGREPFSPKQLKLLKTAIIVMSTVLVIGLAVIIGRIAYLVNQGGNARQASSVTVEQTRLSLPTGAVVRTIALSGERLAVHYEAPAGAGIAVLDLVTGKSVTHIDLSPRQ